jgi:glycosyltransferase involved in cell wall biosynthesis
MVPAVPPAACANVRSVPRLSVVVPARDAERALERTLPALAAQTVGRDAFEVVVVDNGSSDGTAKRARREGARVVETPAGRPRARNAGARAATAPLLVFLDADCVPVSGWLAAMERCLAGAELAGGPVRVTASSAPSAVERFEAAWRLRQERTIAEDGWSGSGNLGIRREVFERLGGFDERYRHAAEDVDLCLRARALGARLVLCREAVVEHPAERGLGGMLRRAARQGHGSAQQHRLSGGSAGRRAWRHPRPLVAGDWALRGLGVDPSSLPPAERRRLLAIARLDYAARLAGSVAAELRR